MLKVTPDLLRTCSKRQRSGGMSLGTLDNTLLVQASGCIATPALQTRMSDMPSPT